MVTVCQFTKPHSKQLTYLSKAEAEKEARYFNCNLEEVIFSEEIFLMYLSAKFFSDLFLR